MFIEQYNARTLSLGKFDIVMWKILRISILLFILAAVATSTWRSKSAAVAWKYTLPVLIYPINADGSEKTQNYINQLKVSEFEMIEEFMQSQADAYGLQNKASIKISLRETLKDIPPAPPMATQTSSQVSVWDVMLWSLKFRWWAYQHAKIVGPDPQVRLFVLYHEPKEGQLHHSTALEKGLIGRVNVYADASMREKNNVIIAHEFLHTLGATDKYNLADNQPNFPQGYAEPDLQPRFPQTFAEIMGGRIPISTTHSETPPHLKRVIIGEQTALEINWKSEK
jgi:hypothetical protein